MSAPPSLRLDMVLWYLRFARSRTRAKAQAQSGYVRCNGRRVTKAHHPVAVGDVLTLVHGGTALVVRLDTLPQRRGPASEARSHYSALVDGLAIAPDRENIAIGQ